MNSNGDDYKLSVITPNITNNNKEHTKTYIIMNLDLTMSMSPHEEESS